MAKKELIIRSQTESSLREWREKEKSALELLRVIGELRFDKSVELLLFRQDVYDLRPSELLNLHLLSKNFIQQDIPVELTLSIADAISWIKDLAPSRIDIGKLALEWMEEKGQYKDVTGFVHDKLNEFIGEGKGEIVPRDVVLYGFGRIGRIAARRLVALTGKGQQLRLKAIVLRQKMKDRLEEAKKRAALLRSDSVHGDFRGVIDVTDDGEQMIINGNRVQLIYAAHPSEIDYQLYGIEDALLIDNTGIWTDRENLSQHLRPGISKVLLTAPGKDIPNIVHGVNHLGLDVDLENIFCAASCTTNAIVPPIRVIDDALGIEKGHIETIHAYTNDQNLLDNFHKKPRRGRAAPLNMVITSTGAASAVAKVLPHMKGKLTGNAVRVPVPNVSLAVLNLTLGKPSTLEELNEILRKASLTGDLAEQIQYSTDTEYVSTNAIGSTSACVIDAPSTILSADGRTVTIYAWYDNEFGYTNQVIRLAKYASKVRRFHYY